MTVFLNNFLIALPLFALVGLGYLFASLRLVTPEIGKALSKFAFTVAIPTLLFRLMSNITQLPAPKLGVPFAFFGSCILVYFFGRILAKKLCHLTTDEQTVFAWQRCFPITSSSGSRFRSRFSPRFDAGTCRDLRAQRVPHVDLRDGAD